MEWRLRIWGDIWGVWKEFEKIINGLCRFIFNILVGKREVCWYVLSFREIVWRR